jgi:hypothetical protein
MARIRNRVENVIKIPAGGVPAAAAAYWYSGKGDSNNVNTPQTNYPGGSFVGDPGSAVAPGGQGMSVEGDLANGLQLSIVVDAWDTMTGVEVIVEANRDPKGALEWTPIGLQELDSDTLHIDVKPLRFKLAKTDFAGTGEDSGGNAGNTALVRIYGEYIGDVVAKRIRFGIRAVGTPGNAALHCAVETVQRYL